MRKRKTDRDGLYKQPASASWYASYTDAEGNRRRRSTGTDSRTEASAILSRWRTQAHQQRTWGTEPAHSLHDLIMAYVEAHRNKRSLERDGYSNLHLYRLIGEDKEIETLTAGDIHVYQKTRINEVEGLT